MNADKFNRIKDEWVDISRPLIIELMSQKQKSFDMDMRVPESYHGKALTLVFPYMDKIYTLRNGRKNSYTEDMLKLFLDKTHFRSLNRNDNYISDKEYKECIKIIARCVVNGLKHDTFIRPGVVISNINTLDIKIEGEKMIMYRTIETCPIKFWENGNGYSVQIATLAFLKVLVSKIDTLLRVKHD